MAVKWNGKAVAAKVRRAQIKGVNRVMGRCVSHAKQNHEWINRTGSLEGSIGIATYARPEGTGVSGTWGSQDIVYARVHELGSAKQNIPPRPYLRPAADVHYPRLAAEIRRELR